MKLCIIPSNLNESLSGESILSHAFILLNFLNEKLYLTTAVFNLGRFPLVNMLEFKGYSFVYNFIFWYLWFLSLWLWCAFGVLFRYLLDNTVMCSGRVTSFLALKLLINYGFDDWFFIKVFFLNLWVPMISIISDEFIPLFYFYLLFILKMIFNLIFWRFSMIHLSAHLFCLHQLLLCWWGLSVKPLFASQILVVLFMLAFFSFLFHILLCFIDSVQLFLWLCLAS